MAYAFFCGQREGEADVRDVLERPLDHGAIAFRELGDDLNRVLLLAVREPPNTPTLFAFSRVFALAVHDAARKSKEQVYLLVPVVSGTLSFISSRPLCQWLFLMFVQNPLSGHGSFAEVFDRP